MKKLFQPSPNEVCNVFAPFIVNPNKAQSSCLLSYHQCTKKAPQNTERLMLAVRTRLELATSCVTGRHSNQLNYRTKISFIRSSLRTRDLPAKTGQAFFQRSPFGITILNPACLTSIGQVPNQNFLHTIVLTNSRPSRQGGTGIPPKESLRDNHPEPRLPDVSRAGTGPKFPSYDRLYELATFPPRRNRHSSKGVPSG